MDRLDPPEHQLTTVHTTCTVYRIAGYYVAVEDQAALAEVAGEVGCLAVGVGDSIDSSVERIGSHYAPSMCHHEAIDWVIESDVLHDSSSDSGASSDDADEDGNAVVTRSVEDRRHVS